jgi:hypothetical protein
MNYIQNLIKYPNNPLNPRTQLNNYLTDKIVLLGSMHHITLSAILINALISSL